MERQRHVAELSHRRDCPRLRLEAVVFRNPDAYHLPVWQGDGRESRECGANPRGMEERHHGIMGYRQFRRPAGWLASIDYDEVGVQWA